MSPSSLTTTEIATQPECWQRAAVLAASEGGKLPRPVQSSKAHPEPLSTDSKCSIRGSIKVSMVLRLTSECLPIGAQTVFSSSTHYPVYAMRRTIGKKHLHLPEEVVRKMAEQFMAMLKTT